MSVISVRKRKGFKVWVRTFRRTVDGGGDIAKGTEDKATGSEVMAKTMMMVMVMVWVACIVVSDR